MSLFYLAVFVIGGGAAVGAAWLGRQTHQQETRKPQEAEQPSRASTNLVRDPGFESGMEHWGTGYLEDNIRNGNWPDDFRRLPYVVGDKPGVPTDSSGRLDTAKARTGLASFRFDHKQPRQVHHYGSLSQRINALRPKTYYVITFWVSADKSDGASFFVTADIPWKHRKYVPAGTYDWQPVTHEFNTENDTYIDLRFVVESPCTMWIDDISLLELTESSRQKRAELGQLIALRESAIHSILNRNVRRDAEWVEFNRDMREWESTIVERLSRLGVPETDITWFKVLGTFHPKGLPGFNELHVRDRNIVAEKLDRLLQILRRLEGVA